MKFSLQDLAAAIVSLILCVGLVLLALESKEIPAALSGPLGLSMGWLFTRSNIVASNGRTSTP